MDPGPSTQVPACCVRASTDTAQSHGDPSQLAANLSDREQSQEREHDGHHVDLGRGAVPVVAELVLVVALL